MLALATVFAVVLHAAPVRAPQPSDLSCQGRTGEAQTGEKQNVVSECLPDRLVCRTEHVIGSRAKKRKVCLTRRQWATVANDGSALARRLVEEQRAGMIGN